MVSSRSDGDGRARLAAFFFSSGAVVAFCVTMFLHEPSTARFIFGSAFTVGNMILGLPLIIAQRKAWKSGLPTFCLMMALQSVPLYFFMSGASVAFWTRLLVSVGMLFGFLSLTIMANQLDERRKRRQAA